MDADRPKNLGERVMGAPRWPRINDGNRANSHIGAASPAGSVHRRHELGMCHCQPPKPEEGNRQASFSGVHLPQLPAGGSFLHLSLQSQVVDLAYTSS